jgi:O-antigen/teichoic acid export membrane protein
VPPVVTDEHDAATRLWRGGAVPLNTVLMGLRTLVIFAVGFLMLPLLIHRLGMAPTGLFVFATTLTGYFTAVELGIATSVTKYVAEFRALDAQERINSMLRGSLLMMIGIGLLVAVALTAFALLAGRALFAGPSVRGQVVGTMLVAAATALLYWPSRIGTAMLEGLERYDQRAIVAIICTVFLLAGLWALSFATHSVPVLAGYFGAIMVLEGAACAAIAWRRVGVIRNAGSWRVRDLRPVLTFGGGLFIIGLADTAIYSLDRLIVAAFVGAAAIVAYEVALRPQTAVRMISALTAGALVSTISRLAAEGQRERLRKLALAGSFIGLVITLPWVILVLVLAKPLIAAWVGHSYVRYAVYAQIFVVYWLTGANGGVLGAFVMGMAGIRIFVILTTIGGVTSLGLSIGMTAAFGTVGVIWGTVIPSVIGFPIWMHFALRRAGVTAREYAWSVALPAYGLAVPWAALVWVGARLIDPSGLIGVGTFGVAALALFAAAAVAPARRHWHNALAG